MGSPPFFFFGLPARAAGRLGRGSACLGFGVAVPPCIAPGGCAASGFGWGDAVRDAGHVPPYSLLPAPAFCARRPRAGAQVPACGPRLPSYFGLRRACPGFHSSPPAQDAFACRAALHRAAPPRCAFLFPARSPCRLIFLSCVRPAVSRQATPLRACAPCCL